MNETALALCKCRTMLERVANELSDPSGEQWCDEPEDDRALLAALLADVHKLLEDT